MHARVHRRRYSKPVQRQTLSIRLNAGAPGDPKPTEETSERCARLFVVHGCMSRLRWQLPASCDQYHRTQDRLPISQDGNNRYRRHSLKCRIVGSAFARFPRPGHLQLSTLTSAAWSDASSMMPLLTKTGTRIRDTRHGH